MILGKTPSSHFRELVTKIRKRKKKSDAQKNFFSIILKEKSDFFCWFLLTIKAHAWCSKHGLSVMFWRIPRKWSGRGTSRSTRHTSRMSIRSPCHDRIPTGQRPIISWHHGGWNWRAGATKVTIEIGFWGHGGRGCCGRLKAWHGRWGVKPCLVEIRIVHCSWKSVRIIKPQSLILPKSYL